MLLQMVLQPADIQPDRFIAPHGVLEKSGENAEKDGNQSNSVVHGLWISSGQVLLRLSSV